MISRKVKEIVESPSNGVIRRMFEEGAALKQRFGADKVYDFSIGNPDLDPPQKVVDAVREVAADLSHLRHGYMPNAGYPEARAAMARKTSAEQGVEVGADCVVMEVGAGGALNVIFKTLLNAGEEIVIPCPYFAEYNNYAANHGGKVIAVSTKSDFSLDVDAIKRALGERIAAVLINSPNNPTGRVYSDAEVSALCDVLRDFGESTGRYPYLVCDEPYRDITYGRTVATVFDKYDYAVIATSFAKNLSVPGERVGYLCVNPSCPEKNDFIAAAVFCTRVLGFVNCPAFFQKVIARSWDARCDFSTYRKRRDEICAVMDYAGLEYAEPDGAFYLWVKCPQGWDDDMEFTAHLKKYNILCAPGSGFAGKGWFRIAYCCAEQSILNSKEAFKKAVEEAKK